MTLVFNISTEETMGAWEREEDVEIGKEKINAGREKELVDKKIVESTINHDTGEGEGFDYAVFGFEHRCCPYLMIKMTKKRERDSKVILKSMWQKMGYKLN